MSRGIPQRGDIIELSLDPTLGHEIRGSRPVLVLSADAFNKASGLLLVAPITQGGTAAREHGFSVALMGSGARTHGMVLCDRAYTTVSCAQHPPHAPSQIFNKKRLLPNTSKRKQLLFS